MLSVQKSMLKWSNTGMSLVLAFIGLRNVGTIFPKQFVAYCVAFLDYCVVDVLGECFKVNQFNKEATDRK